MIALIELTPVRSPGFEKESAVMSPLIRPEPQQEKKSQKIVCKKKKCTFLFWSSLSFLPVRFRTLSGLESNASDIGDPDTNAGSLSMYVPSLFLVHSTSI